ncbi:MAG TPA: hypothetical protein VI893_10465 [Thermoplasmata archaeon]|nr:hypothetical protein [Thermoplasmata archaeon]
MPGYSLTIESSGLDVRRLYEWCTDFRDDDARMLEREQGVDASMIMERKVTREPGRVRMEMPIRLAGGVTDTLVEIDLHPEQSAYVADIRFGEAYRQICTYFFAPRAGGALVHILAYVERGGESGDRLAASGDFVADLREGMRKLMTAYVRQAERELGGK